MFIKLMKKKVFIRNNDRQEKCTIEKKRQNALQIVTAELLFNTSHTIQQNYYTSGVIRNFTRIFLHLLTKYKRHQRYHTYACTVS